MITDRNDDFYLNAPDGSPFPYLDRITTVQLTDAEARIAALETGRVDIVSFDPAEFQNAVGAVNSIGEDRVEMQVSPLAGVNYIALNVNRPPFDTLEGRRAAYLLFNRARMQQLSQLPSGENATMITGYLGTVDPFLDEVTSLPENADIDAAIAEGQQLAAQAGLEGFSLLVSSTPGFFQGMAQLIAQIYEDAGVDVSIRLLDRTATNAARAAGDFHVSLDTPNVVLPSVSAFFREQYLPGGREPFVALPPDSFMQVYDQILVTQEGPERQDLIREALRIMREDWIPVVPYEKQVGSSELIANWVHGRRPSTGQWFNMHWYHDIWVDGSSPRS